MKTKMFILSSLWFLFLTGRIAAQDYKISVNNTKDSKVSLFNFTGELTIQGYSGNEIIITPVDAEAATVPERAKGLKPIYSGGTDNTGYGLSVEKNGTQVTINCLLPFTHSSEYIIKVPENLALSVKSECENSNNLIISGLKNEIEVQNCFSINLKDVSGPLVLSTISGDIEVSFSSIASGKPFSINTVSGEIDITIPASLAADIEMNSITGKMYSDFDFSDKTKDIKQVGGNVLKYKMNGGGAPFSIVTVSGNIYLRKSN